MTFQETIYIFYLKLVKYDTFFQTKNIKDELFLQYTCETILPPPPQPF